MKPSDQSDRDAKRGARGKQLSAGRTYVGESPRNFVIQAIHKASEETASTGQDDIAHEHLTKFRIAGAKSVGDEVGNGLRLLHVGRVLL